MNKLGMRRTNKRVIRNRIMLTVLIGAAVCAAWWQFGGGKEDGAWFRGDKPKLSAPQPAEWSAWLVDWDWQVGAAELSRTLKAEQGLTELQAFGGYFDEDDRLIFREGFPAMLEEASRSASRSGAKLYLTLVNDIVAGVEAPVYKDSTLVGRLTESRASRQEHIERITDAVRAYGADGVEIDYENVEERYWPQLTQFYAELYAALSREGLLMRVVLEPRAPIDKHRLPEGPQYVMMAYNLYGLHSGPGPKADLAMIGQIAAKLDAVPGEKGIALAAGGFDWREDGHTIAVTEQAAAALSKLSSDAPQRDAASGALYFAYTDESGKAHTVWYADAETLRQWADAANRRGLHRIALWRLGGLAEPTLDYLGHL